MALEHRIEEQSIGNDGRSILLKDATTGFGVDSNPARSTLAWIVALTCNTGNGPQPVEGIVYQVDTGTPEDPNYEQSTALEGTHLLLPLATDGLYWLTSVLLYRKSALDNTAGYTLVNELCVDDVTHQIERVVGAAQVFTGGVATGTYTYTFEPVTAIEKAVEESYPSTTYPVLQLHGLVCELDKACLKYLTTKGQAACNQSSCHNDENKGRDLYFDLAFELNGAEANLENGLYDNVLCNLVQAGEIVERIHEDC